MAAPPVLPTAFVSHADCSRHDPGWKHPDHQGRLPALVRAVYRDMLTLHDHLLQVEGRPATAAELRRVHSRDYIEAVRAAAAQAQSTATTQHLPGGAAVSAASWDAALAAAGVAVRGVEVVLAGEAANAFCATRPPGRDAARDAAGPFALFNNAAVAARAALTHPAVQRVLILDTAAVPGTGTTDLFADEPAVRVGVLHASITLPTAADGEQIIAPLRRLLSESGRGGFAPDLILWSLGFDMLRTNPAGGPALEPADYHRLTRHVRSFAEHACGGRLVALLEHGWAAADTGAAVVQHLRALAGLPPV